MEVAELIERVQAYADDLLREQVVESKDLEKAIQEQSIVVMFPAIPKTGAQSVHRGGMEKLDKAREFDKEARALNFSDYEGMLRPVLSRHETICNERKRAEEEIRLLTPPSTREGIRLEWLDARKMALLPGGAALSPGKNVVLRGTGYPNTDVRSARAAQPYRWQFDLYRVPSPILAWALAQLERTTRWRKDEVGARPTSYQPFLMVDSDGPVTLAPAGFFKMHRWQFTDWCENWSPVMRTTRVAALKIGATAGYSGVGGNLDVTVATAVDPSLRIEVAVPWSEGGAPTPQDILSDEIEDLAQLVGRDEIGAPDDVLASLGKVFPTERPMKLRIDWAPGELTMGDGDTEVFNVGIQTDRPFALCFVAFDRETDDIVGSSEVVVMSPDSSGRLAVLGAEG